MASSSTPASGSSVQPPWWREWLKPIVVVAVISLLVGALTLVTNIGVATLQSLKADIRAGNAQLTEEVKDVRREVKDLREEVKASEARLREEIKASEARQRQDLKEVRAELKADNKALREELKADNQALREELKADNQELRTELKADNRAVGERLDRVFEGLLADKSEQATLRK